MMLVLQSINATAQISPPDPEVKNEERYYFRFYLYEDIGIYSIPLVTSLPMLA